MIYSPSQTDPTLEVITDQALKVSQVNRNNELQAVVQIGKYFFWIRIHGSVILIYGSGSRRPPGHVFGPGLK
jgi:hypothetical protein